MKAAGAPVVDVYWAPRDGLQARPECCTDAERARADRALDGQAWLATRAWVRQRLAEHYLTAPAQVPLASEPAGRPILTAPLPITATSPPPAVSIAHSDSVVALALSLSPAPLGVDVEDLPDTRHDLLDLAAVVATPGELADLQARARNPAELPTVFQRWWTRKEALVKALGTGFTTEPREVHVGVEKAHPPAPWRVHDLGRLPLPTGPALTLVTAGAARVRVHPPTLYAGAPDA